MTFQFLPQPPRDFPEQPILISGRESTSFTGQEFLVVIDHEKEYVFEIRHEYRCSPFRDVYLAGNILGVGHEEHFYMFDVEKAENLLTLKVAGYFGGLYFEDDLFYVASASGIYCVNNAGKIIWENTDLGIDGVTITSFQDKLILGIGEWDPPGGWREFKVDRLTGQLY